MAFADIKFITFRVKLNICDSSKSLTFPKEKHRFLHFGGYRGVKNDVGCFGRRQKTPPSKSPTLFLLGKCLIFLRKNNVFWIEQTSLRTFAQFEGFLFCTEVCMLCKKTLFSLGKLLFLKISITILQTSLRTFALWANVLKDVCSIVQTSLRTFAHLHGKNKGFWKVFGGLHSNFIQECVHIVHFPADVCFSTTFSKKRANVLKDVCSIYNLSKRP